MTDLERELELAKAKQDIFPQISLSDEDYQYMVNRLAQDTSPAMASNETIKNQYISGSLLGLAMGLSLEDATDRGNNSAWTEMLNRGYSDPSYNEPLNDASQLEGFGAKMRVIQEGLNDITHFSSRDDTRDWQAAVTSGDAIGGLRSATGEMFGNVSVDFKTTIPGESPIPVVVDGEGNVLTSTSSRPSVIADTLARFGVKDLSSAAVAAEKARQENPNIGNSAQRARAREAQTFADAIERLEYKSPVGTTGLATRSTAYEQAGTFSKKLQTAGGSTTSVAANTGVFDYAADENVPVEAVPKTVTQQVAPPNYYGQFVPTATESAISAVPTTATYKTHYAGTPGLVDPTLYAPVGGGVQQVIYGNDLGQRITVTEVNGTPTTYYPPDYKRLGTAQEVAQQQTSGMATSGAVRGYAAGGDVALIKLAKMNGMQGDDIDTARAFMNASEGLRNKVKAMGALMNRGGLAMAQGGSVPNQAMIGGQPHRLAYVNPQEEAMMKAAGGAGVPSYGGIPAYFSLGPGTTVGETATDPSTGTVYTWNGTSWDMDDATGQSNTFPVQQAQRTQNLITQTMQPIQAPVSYTQPEAADFVPVDAGQATPIAPYAEAATISTVQQANQQATPTSETYDFTPAYSQVQAQTAGLQPAQGVVSAPAQVAAQQQTTTALTGMKGAQGTATDVVATAPRELQTGELIDPVADASSAAAFTEQVQAATATPSAQATVAGQLEGLMQQFEGGETPAWAAGSMRTAMATLSARGLGASSLAGQAVIQATMEAALPIAQMDAQVQAQFESQNLTNRQQRAMLSAQQRATFLGMEFDQGFQARVQNSARIGDIANMNFSAEQNIALENARAANTMNLNNLSNRQAMVMAEAAALSNLDMANLNNRQQAAVQNAQSFLQMDMANLSNEQQTAIFKTQQNVQALFTDQAAENAAAQFNATSQNQTDQYFANLRSQTSQFNASQQNAMDQFNVNSVNALREFNSEIQQQRDLFNAQNGLLIAQSNAQWRQTLSTANTAAQNESNMNFAKTINALTATNLDAYWQRERDVMSFAYASGESAADRVATVLAEELKAEAQMAYADAQGQGGLFATLLKGGLNYMGLASDQGKRLIN